MLFVVAWAELLVFAVNGLGRGAAGLPLVLCGLVFNGIGEGEDGGGLPDGKTEVGAGGMVGSELNEKVD